MRLLYDGKLSEKELEIERLRTKSEAAKTTSAIEVAALNTQLSEVSK